MRNPRRDAIEYGIFLVLLGCSATGYGLLGLVRYHNFRNPEQKIAIDLEKPFNFDEMMRELKLITGMGGGGKEGKPK